MQEDARRTNLDRTESVTGLVAASSAVVIPIYAASRKPLVDAPVLANPVLTCSPIPLQTKGWLGKALEFINSGPPALLNNPCCSRRVVNFPFLKHAMEVHYG